jgi:outer membrane protein TolC
MVVYLSVLEKEHSFSENVSCLSVYMPKISKNNNLCFDFETCIVQFLFTLHPLTLFPMKKTSYTLLFLLIFAVSNSTFAQKDTMLLTFEQLIDIARNSSPQGAMARHSFKSSYWQYRSFRAGYLPSLSLTSTPLGINRSLSVYTLQDGSDTFIERRGNNSNLQLNLAQKVPFTGGEFILGSSFQRTDFFTDSSTITSFMANPINISYRQPLFTFNSYKWERKIEPLRYEEARKNFQAKLEDISQRAVQQFFDLMLAQINTEISRINFQNNDTLYKIAQGRYNIGTIARDELLQMELTFLNSKNSYNQSLNDLEDYHFRLRSFLGFPNTTVLKIIVPDSVPNVTISSDKALELALKNNPKMLAIQRSKIEADREVARTRSERLMNADLYVSFGLSKSDAELKNLTSDLLDQQMVSVGLSIPLVDWGRGKGRYKMALSNRDLTKIMAEQEQLDFEQQIFLQVLRFNMQKEQILTATKADTISQLRYEIAKQRFMVGKVGITDLNIAGNERDGARRSYVSAIRDYWLNYFMLRSLTAYDFIRQEEIVVDFEEE